MCEYVDQVGSTYYLRRAVPLELRGVFLTRSGAPRVDWKESLGTKDRETAKQRLHVRVLELDREIVEARARGVAPQASETGHRRASANYRAWEAARDEYMREAAEIGRTTSEEKEASRENLAGAVAFLEERLQGSTADLPPELHPVNYLLEHNVYEGRIAREQLAIARSELARTGGDATANVNISAHIQINLPLLYDNTRP